MRLRVRGVTRIKCICNCRHAKPQEHRPTATLRWGRNQQAKMYGSRNLALGCLGFPRLAAPCALNFCKTKQMYKQRGIAEQIGVVLHLPECNRPSRNPKAGGKPAQALQVSAHAARPNPRAINVCTHTYIYIYAYICISPPPCASASLSAFLLHVSCLLRVLEGFRFGVQLFSLESWV